MYWLLNLLMPVCGECRSLKMVDISPTSEFRKFFLCKSCGSTKNYRAR